MAEPLGELLRSLRSAALISQETLAERSGLSARTVSDIETGSARTPRLITIMLLAEALGLSEPDRERLKDAARRPPARSAGTGAIERGLGQAGVLVGRDRDAEQVGALLLRDDVALVTLVGPAGVGKTSLAIRVAIDNAGAFEHGVTVTELAPITEPSQVPAAVARALGIRESGDTPAGEAVAAYVRERAMLLVLENLEHLTPAAAWIGALLAQSPRLTILATSREPIRLKAERVFGVRPLDAASSVKLFVERARMVKPEFSIDASNSGAVDTIVGHLDGLPLAIELAAPRLQLLPPKALAARLERRLPLLGDGATDRPQRQQTMHGAIAWSYDLLSESEQRLFRRLGVLHGGGTLEAASAMAGIDDRDDRSILFALAPLVEKNMLWLAEDAEAEPRVSMLGMLREFAHERLVESGELADAQRRHAEYVVQFTAGAERHLTSSSQARRLAHLERDHANIAAALEWAATNGRAEMGFRLVSELWRFWWLNGYLSEGVAWIRRFVALRAPAPAAVPDVLYGKVLRGHVVLLSALGSFDEARGTCEEAISLQRRLGDESGLAASLTSLGVIDQFGGQFDRSEEAHAESLAIRRRIGDESGVATSLSNLSSVAYGKNDLARAATFGEESLAIYRRLGHESGLAHALTKIGLVAAAEGKYGRAEELFSECLRMQRTVGNTGSMVYSLVNLGAVAHKRGQHELAMARYHEALDLLERVPNKAALAKALEDIAATTAALGDPAKGARLLGAADAIRRTIRSPLFPSELAEYEATVASMRGMLGDDAFDAQWHVGSSVTLERALEEARETKVPIAAGRNRHSGASHGEGLV